MNEVHLNASSSSLSDDEILGNSIRFARERQGMTQSGLAADMRLRGFPTFSQVTITTIEKGDRRVSAWELAAVADALDDRVESLLERDPSTVRRRYVERTGKGYVDALRQALPLVSSAHRLRDEFRNAIMSLDAVSTGDDTARAKYEPLFGFVTSGTFIQELAEFLDNPEVRVLADELGWSADDANADGNS